MGINPETNRIESLVQATPEMAAELKKLKNVHSCLLRPDGSPVPKHWTILKIGELVTVKGYTFRVVYINDASIVLEPVSPTDALGPIND